MRLIDLGLFVVKSLWAFSYATASFATLVLTGVAISGAATKNRSLNIVLCLLSNHLSELPLTIMFTDACFYTWLNITGIFQESLLVRFFYYTNIITAIGLLYLFKRSFEVRELGQKFLDQISKESRDWTEMPGLASPRFWQQLLNPFHYPRDCTVYQNIPYWTQPEQLRAQKSDGWESVVDMALDIYRPNTVQGGDDRPILFYMHGGGWTQGSKKLIVPLITEMISHDWIVVSVDYRLNTKAGYPTQLLDCKRALRWVKDEIRTFGGNPNNIVVAGDSAGGQMAAMIALTPNVAEYQPGFEDVDTTVQGCLGLSAVLNLVDLENYSNHDARGRFIKEVAKREGSPESADNLKFLTEHSPRFRIKGAGVPFMIVHGDIDTLTPVQHARNFVSEYEKTCTAPISYLEIPGGHHCFHVISSPRSWYVTIATAEWLNCHFDSGNPKSSVDITANIVNGNTRGRDKDLGSDFVLSSSKSKLQVQDIVEWGWTV